MRWRLRQTFSAFRVFGSKNEGGLFFNQLHFSYNVIMKNVFFDVKEKIDAMCIFIYEQKIWKSVSLFDSEMMLLFIILHPATDLFFS